MKLPLNSNFSGKIPILEHDKKLNYSDDYVNLKLMIDLFSEKKLSIPISVSNFPDNKVLKLFPSEVELSFSSSIGDLKNINSLDFLVGFNYDSIVKGEKTAKVKLLKAPNEAKNIRLNPNKVFFLIRE